MFVDVLVDITMDLESDSTALAGVSMLMLTLLMLHPVITLVSNAVEIGVTRSGCGAEAGTAGTLSVSAFFSLKAHGLNQQTHPQ